MNALTVLMLSETERQTLRGWIEHLLQHDNCLTGSEKRDLEAILERIQ